MRIIHPFLVIVLSLLLAWNQVQAQEQTPYEYLIVPGERIGSYRLGLPPAFFEESLGDDLLVGFSQGRVTSRFTTRPIGFGVAFCDDSAGHIFIYSSQHPVYPERDALMVRYRTREGISLGSSVADAKRIYGTPERESRVFMVSMDYFARGLRMLWRRDPDGRDKVVQIGVLKKGSIWGERIQPNCP